jgi:hypothetical protein
MSTRGIGGRRFVHSRAARGVIRQSSFCAASRIQPSTLGPRRRTRTNCSWNALEATDNLDPLDRPEPGDPGIKLPNQAQSVVQGNEQQLVTVLERDDKKEGGETDYLQVRKCACLPELAAWL